MDISEMYVHARKESKLKTWWKHCAEMSIPYVVVSGGPKNSDISYYMDTMNWDICDCITKDAANDLFEKLIPLWRPRAYGFVGCHGGHIPVFTDKLEEALDIIINHLNDKNNWKVGNIEEACGKKI